MPNYKNAFRCKKCPESASEKGCPLWWEVILTNETGETKITKGCGYRILPEMLVLTAKQAMHTTYAAYDMRNKVVKNVSKVITAVKDQLKLDIPDEIEDELKLIEGEDKEDGIS